MRRLWLLPFLLIVWRLPLLASTDTVHTQPPGDEESDASLDSGGTIEDAGIIPKNAGIVISTQVVTPISEAPETKAYDQGLQELDQATFLAKSGDPESASDLALQAYDDLCQVHIRRPKKKRAKLHAQRYQAATLYMQASVAYLKNYVKSGNGNAAIIDEGRARLGDLKDVAHDYPDLLHWLNKLEEQYPASLDH